MLDVVLEQDLGRKHLERSNINSLSLGARILKKFRILNLKNNYPVTLKN